MSIQLVTYANQTVTPTNDAIIYERAIDQNGIFYGCNVTVSSNEVHITGGYGMVCGREFTIESESIAVTLAPSGTLDGRLYVRLDLADADAPIQLLTATGNTLPPLEQDADVNYTNGTWEMELATFTVGVSALSDVVETFETIVGSKQVPSVITDYIVEQGTNTYGTYRKWASGVAECWGSAQIASGSYTGSWVYALTFFDKTKVVIQMTPIESGTAWNVNYAGSTTTNASIGRTPNTATNTYYMYAVGTWK